MNLLEALRERRGLTFLMVSHDLAVVTHLCGAPDGDAARPRGRVVAAADLAGERVTADYTSAHAGLGGVRRKAVEVEPPP